MIGIVTARERMKKRWGVSNTKTGWREHPTQQKAKRRGSTTISFSGIRKQFGHSDN